jgi:replicative DNA helicase
MQTSDPEMFKLIEQDRALDRQSQEMAVKCQRASGQERSKLKDLLEQLVNKHFDIRQQRRALELKRLDEELKRLHEAMDARAKARKDIVAKRLSELLGREDDLHF